MVLETNWFQRNETWEATLFVFSEFLVSILEAQRHPVISDQGSARLSDIVS